MTPENSDTPIEPLWRPFLSLSRRERSLLQGLQAQADLTHHEVTCLPGTTNSSLIGPATGGGWDWWVFNADGVLLDHGHEASRGEAARTAAEAQPLWYHRCSARGLCRCRKPPMRDGCGGPA